MDALTGVGVYGVLEVDDTGALMRDRGFGIVGNKKTFIQISPNHGAEARTLELESLIAWNQGKAGSLGDSL